MNVFLAYNNWGLKRLVELLGLAEYLVADNAYINSDHVITPYNRAQLTSMERSNYNFFVSQLRIRIEMAFALLTSKWRIFKRDLEVKIRNAPRIIQVCCILHNFCINEREGNDITLNELKLDGSTVSEQSRFSDFYQQSTPTIHENQPSESEHLREILAQYISSQNMVRPQS
jgi:hypothetical protein